VNQEEAEAMGEREKLRSDKDIKAKYDTILKERRYSV
jgi:hypothetical protein